LAQKLIDKGFTDVYALKGGWQDWFRNKYPVEEK
jgi:rhodanese-related sulfurtransferase